MEYTYSVSIPHYNSSRLLMRMLKSIPERDDIQVIIVDDGSEKEDVAELKKLQHKNLELILLKENKGGGNARNVGLQHAKGKWFISADADDYFSENAFNVFDQYKNMDLDFLGFCVECVNSETGEVIRELKANHNVKLYLKKKTNKTEKLLRFQNTEAWNKLVSMDFIRKHHIHFEDCRINIDVLYSFYIGLNAEKYKVIPDKLYYLTENHNSITHKKRTVLREFNFYLQVQKRNGFYEAIKLKKWPFYRYDFLYIPYLIKKRGLIDTIDFFIHWFKNKNERMDARKAYLGIVKTKNE